MSVYDWFFLAMARWRQGERASAIGWFDKAVAWTKAKDPKNAELRQFWREAAELLGQPVPVQPAEAPLAIPDQPFAP